MDEVKKRIAEIAKNFGESYGFASERFQIVLLQVIRAALQDPILTQPIRDKALDDALACYSPDDSANDWADKIRDLKGTK